MSRKRFKDIKSIIVQRGEYYYLSGRVKNIRQDGNTYMADIFGTEDYETSVEIVNDELVSCSCNCPYDRGICKHVAALLFAVEDEANDIERFDNFNYHKIEEESFNIQATFNALVKLKEECINRCFGSFSKNGREFWPISLHVIDSLAFLFDLPSPNLWLKYSEIFKRFKEFRKNSEYWY